MRSTIAVIGTIAAVATLLITITLVSSPPANPAITQATVDSDAKEDLPDTEWKSIRNDKGQRIRWHSCTVTYAVDLNSYTPERAEPLDLAITDAEDASGLEFEEVPWDEADLQIQLAHEREGNVVARTFPMRLKDTNVSAKILAYPKSRGYPEHLQTDIYRHEIGHALGLAHIYGNDTMSAVVRTNPTQDGWSTGLQWLYQDCR